VGKRVVRGIVRGKGCVGGKGIEVVEGLKKYCWILITSPKYSKSVVK
jgi:hypothetical protein